MTNKLCESCGAPAKYESLDRVYACAACVGASCASPGAMGWELLGPSRPLTTETAEDLYLAKLRAESLAEAADADARTEESEAGR